jgi:hypothetical protein
MTPEAGTAGALVSALCVWLDRLFPDADRGERLKRALDERFGEDTRTVTGSLCREVEGVAHEFSRHFALEYVADGSLVVLDWLLGGEPTHVCDVVYRDRTRQWWTTGRLADLALPRATPVAVLIGERTFSSGEALAYHVQSQGRARLVGQRTPGAADHITPVRVSRHVCAFLPEARVRDAVTESNWEGTGVVPVIVCEPAAALDAALGVVGR